MRVVALLTIRNEALLLDRCLHNLVEHGVETYVVDNGSTDDSYALASSFLGRGVIGVEHLPYEGTFELAAILQHKEQLTQQIEADWFIHHDADEIREAPRPFDNLADGIAAADRAGYNAINFDEFVFLPTSTEEAFEGTDYVDSMRYYYFFEPRPLRRINAWKALPGVTPNLTDSAGHSASFAGRRTFPTNFILRHYLALSRAHALAKYAERTYSDAEISQRGWHRDRARFAGSQLCFPPRRRLKQLEPGLPLDTSDPWPKHPIFKGRHLGLLGRARARVWR